MEKYNKSSKKTIKKEQNSGYQIILSSKVETAGITE